MAVYKEPKTNTWRAVYRYKDWTGETRQTQKRGFATRRDALTWEREQMLYEQAEYDLCELRGHLYGRYEKPH